MAGNCCVFKFFQRSVHRKHLMRFPRETSVFKSGVVGQGPECLSDTFKSFTYIVNTVSFRELARTAGQGR